MAVSVSKVGLTPVLVTIQAGIVLPYVQAAFLAAPHLHFPVEVSQMLTVPTVATLGRHEFFLHLKYESKLLLNVVGNRIFIFKLQTEAPKC